MVDQALPLRLEWAQASFVIKAIGPDALEFLVAIELRAHATPWGKAHLQSSLKSHRCYGLYKDSALCAYAIISVVLDEAELLLFVVDTPWQGKGIGRQFLNALLKHVVCHCSQMYLEVRQSNAGAIALYEAAGFNEVGVRPNYYTLKNRQREDALVFAIELSAELD